MGTAKYPVATVGGRATETSKPDNRETDTVALREFNNKLHHDQRIALSLLPIADGLTLALKL